MKPPPFAYAAPETLDEAVALKAGEGDDALVLAGGQSLIPLMALRLASPSLLVDLNRIAAVGSVEQHDGSLVVGAMARHRDVEELGAGPSVLTDALPMIGHRAIRNRGTVGGSIAHADPAAEWPGVALVLDAAIDARSPVGDRTIAAEDFFLAPFTNALAPDEIVREVRFHLPGPGAGSAFVEHARRHGDFALVGVAAMVGLDAGRTVTTARLALVGVGGTPIRATGGEDELVGGSLTDAEVRASAAACAAAVDPPSSVHASAAYRRHLVEVLVARAIRLARDRARAA